MLLVSLARSLGARSQNVGPSSGKRKGLSLESGTDKACPAKDTCHKGGSGKGWPKLWTFKGEIRASKMK